MPRYNPKGKPTKAELEWMGRVAELPCCKCGAIPVDVHHITECGRRLGHYWVLPLCKEHHAKINNFKEQMKLCRQMHAKHNLVFFEPTTKIIKRVD